ncbi:MAG: hypothetical protein RR371_02045 [Bacteroides sp.]
MINDITKTEKSFVDKELNRYDCVINPGKTKEEAKDIFLRPIALMDIAYQESQKIPTQSKQLKQLQKRMKEAFNAYFKSVFKDLSPNLQCELTDYMDGMQNHTSGPLNTFYFTVQREFMNLDFNLRNIYSSLVTISCICYNANLMIKAMNRKGDKDIIAAEHCAYRMIEILFGKYKSDKNESYEQDLKNALNILADSFIQYKHESHEEQN